MSKHTRNSQAPSPKPSPTIFWHDELIAYQTRSDSSILSFTLFQRGDQAITIQVYVDGMTKTKLQHMEHFLSFIKPHIINVLLHREMVIDNLTGFYLRGYFMEKLREEFDLSRRYHLDLSVIMIDVEALKIAHQLRGEIEKEFAYGRPYQITVSVGVSSLELCNPSSIEQLIEQADTAEITAKKTGKNKVIAAWDL